MKLPIYLDNHATTRLAPEVLEGMLPYLSEHYGNSHSPHPFGWVAKDAVEKARKQVANLLGCAAREVFFTSGATEANNWALIGLCQRHSFQGHIVTSQCEHKSVLEVLKKLEKLGMKVTFLPVDSQGQISPQQVIDAIQADTLLVSIMAANNEVGTIFPTRELGGICKNKGVLFHVDAAQAIGKIPVDVEAWNADLVSLSAHKFHGPKGVGALYIRRQNPRVILEPLHVGGGQEIGQRAGTLNVPGIVGMGIACALIDLNQHTPYVCGLRDRLLHRLLKEVPNARLNGSEQARLPNNINIFLPVLNPGETLLSRFPQIAFSIGSACSTGIGEYSHVLKAMGLDRATALASARFGLSRYTTLEEIDQTADVLCASAVPKL